MYQINGNLKKKNLAYDSKQFPVQGELQPKNTIPRKLSITFKIKLMEPFFTLHSKKHTIPGGVRISRIH